MSSLTALKIKNKTLASEVRLIKLEECKWLNETQKARLRQKAARAEKCDSTFKSLNHHRKYVVRVESRANNIARGYLTGKPLERIERDWYAASYIQPNQPLQESYDMFWEKVVRVVYRFGKGCNHVNGKTMSEVREDIRRWREVHPLVASGIQIGRSLPGKRVKTPPLTPEQRELNKQAWIDKHGKDWEDPVPY